MRENWKWGAERGKANTRQYMTKLASFSRKCGWLLGHMGWTAVSQLCWLCPLSFLSWLVLILPHPQVLLLSPLGSLWGKQWVELGQTWVMNFYDTNTSGYMAALPQTPRGSGGSWEWGGEMTGAGAVVAATGMAGVMSGTLQLEARQTTEADGVGRVNQTRHACNI